MSQKNENNIYTFRGKTSFAKVLPHQLNPTYDAKEFGTDEREWKMDLVITPATAKEAGKIGIGAKVKQGNDKYLPGENYITFKQKEKTRDGEANKPMTIVDLAGRPWPEDQELGNGTTVDVKFAVVKGKYLGVYVRKITVLDHVPYVRDNFEPLPEDDEFYEAQQRAKQVSAEELRQFREDFDLQNDGDDLNDDIPID